MIQDALVVAADFFEGIGQNRQVAEPTFGVDRLGQGDHLWRQPSGVRPAWPVRVLENVAEEWQLTACLWLRSCLAVSPPSGLSRRPGSGKRPSAGSTGVPEGRIKEDSLSRREGPTVHGRTSRT